MIKKKKKILLIFSLATLIGGCSAFKSENSTLFANQGDPIDNSTNLPLPNTLGLPAPSGNEDIKAIPGQKTVAVVSANRALMNMLNCLGTESPTEGARAAQAVWEEKKGQFSVEGKANTVTPPMLMAQASLAAEVCSDAIRIESALPSSERRLFPMINFGSGPNSVGSAALGDTIRRLARSCWGRNESDEERSMIVTEARSAFSGTNPATTRLQLLYICSSLLSSTSGLEI